MHRSVAFPAVALAVFWATNSSWLAQPGDPPRWIAHRGVHATFELEGVGPDTCTATRIHPVEHGLLENTLPSMAAAFEAGAEAVEVDLRVTRDGHLVAFHDHGLDCRTNGTGRPEDHTLAELKQLDPGFGYTSDGTTYPLRGTSPALWTTLPEILEAFPDRRFVFHLKSGRPEAGERVADVLEQLPSADRARHIVYGGEAAERVHERLPEVRRFTKTRMKACLKGYAAFGWAGVVPESCRNTWVLVPANVAPFLWGWPHRFRERMEAAGSEVVLAGPLVDGNGTGIDTPTQVEALPDGLGGWIWTNRIEAVGPR